jgi:hypothetical protein
VSASVNLLQRLRKEEKVRNRCLDIGTEDWKEKEPGRKGKKI